MYIVNNIRLELNEKDIVSVIAKKLRIDRQHIISYKFYKKAIDSRDKNHVFFLCHFLIDVNKKVVNKIVKNKDVVKYIPYKLKLEKINTNKKVVVVGAGPAGLFASYYLALNGIKVVLIERGKKVEDRYKDIEDFITSGTLNEDSNLQFGEGGAGTFSDGKLTTTINDERIEFIKNVFIKFGANEDIGYLSKPHIGSDVLYNVLKNFRKELTDLGVEIHFDTKLVDIEIDDNKLSKIVVEENSLKKQRIMECDYLLLATGHSARDIYYMLNKYGVNLEKKPFSIGVRIEHKQEDINKSQYGEKYYNHPSLPNADYKLNVKLDNGRTLHTFCMCPGGVVVASSSENGEIVTNGMSYYARDKENANSALLVNVKEEDLDKDLFAGIEFQKKYERLAYELSNSYKAPCQRFADLINNKETSICGDIKPSYEPGVFYTNLRKCLPQFVIDTLIEGIPFMDQKIKGFANDNALLTAPETRSSSPLRIVRDETYQTNVKGIFPVGEGSGYSSGITTSALDGIRVATKIIELLK